jgi:hypothetical protein
MSVFQGEIGVHMDRPTRLFSQNQLKAFLSFPENKVKKSGETLDTKGESN